LNKPSPPPAKGQQLPLFFAGYKLVPADDGHYWATNGDGERVKKIPAWQVHGCTKTGAAILAKNIRNKFSAPQSKGKP
jgi:hypothetical protein